MPFPKGHQKIGGRKKGSANKTTAQLKEVILEALNQASGGDGGINYIKQVAETDPYIFFNLLAKVLPLVHAGDKENPVSAMVTWVGPSHPLEK